MNKIIFLIWIIVFSLLAACGQQKSEAVSGNNITKFKKRYSLIKSYVYNPQYFLEFKKHYGCTFQILVNDMEADAHFTWGNRAGEIFNLSEQF